MDKFIIAQIFGFAGLACSVAAYQCKKHRSVMLLKTSNELLFAFQYFFSRYIYGNGYEHNKLDKKSDIFISCKKRKEHSSFSNYILYCIYCFGYSYMEKLFKFDCNIGKAFNNCRLRNEGYKISSFCNSTYKYILVNL